MANLIEDDTLALLSVDGKEATCGGNRSGVFAEKGGKMDDKTRAAVVLKGSRSKWISLLMRKAEEPEATFVYVTSVHEKPANLCS